jgi:hypothetical protein
VAEVRVDRALPALALLVLAGCAQQADPLARGRLAPAASVDPAPSPTVSTVRPPPQPGRVLYQCDTGQAVVVQDEGDTVLVSGLPGGEERLGRDAGGLTPQQSVFSGPTLRAEFGLDADARGMALQFLDRPELLHCRRG